MARLSAAVIASVAGVAVALLLAWPFTSAVVRAQAPGVLHIKVLIRDADGKLVPVPRHALLISDNPNTETPRRVVTGADGTVDVRVKGGNYTVESDRPLAYAGKGYQWTETLDVAAGREVTLELSERNAEIGPISGATPLSAGVGGDAGSSPGASATPDASASARGDVPGRTDPALLFAPLQPGVVRLWSARARASGFVIDNSPGRGLIATSQKVVGTSSSVDVQLTATQAIEGRVLAADARRDIAIVRVDPAALAAVKPIPLPCSQLPATALKVDDELVALGLPLNEQQDRIIRGNVNRLDDHVIVADLRLPLSAIGGPLFTLDGALVGVTTTDPENVDARRQARAVPLADACVVLRSAEAVLASVPAPPAANIPSDPVKPFPAAALKEAFSKRAGNLQPYQLSGSDFEVAFITPLMVYAAQQPDQRTTSRDTRGGNAAQLDQLRLPKWFDFSNWSEYMADVPPVLALRVTPKLDEGFWTTVARGAARTQGVNLPPMKHFKAAFSRMRVLCGDTEVRPIHRLLLESRTAMDENIVEGLQVFDPGALGPQCGSVKVQLFSEKEPEKADTKTVEPATIQKLWQDFEPYRAQP